MGDLKKILEETRAKKAALMRFLTEGGEKPFEAKTSFGYVVAHRDPREPHKPWRLTFFTAGEREPDGHTNFSSFKELVSELPAYGVHSPEGIKRSGPWSRNPWFAVMSADALETGDLRGVHIVNAEKRPPLSVDIGPFTMETREEAEIWAERRGYHVLGKAEAAKKARAKVAAEAKKRDAKEALEELRRERALKTLTSKRAATDKAAAKARAKGLELDELEYVSELAKGLREAAAERARHVEAGDAPKFTGEASSAARQRDWDQREIAGRAKTIEYQEGAELPSEMEALRQRARDVARQMKHLPYVRKIDKDPSATTLHEVANEILRLEDGKFPVFAAKKLREIAAEMDATQTRGALTEDQRLAMSAAQFARGIELNNPARPGSLEKRERLLKACRDAGVLQKIEKKYKVDLSAENLIDCGGSGCGWGFGSFVFKITEAGEDAAAGVALLEMWAAGMPREIKDGIVRVVEVCQPSKNARPPVWIVVSEWLRPLTPGERAAMQAFWARHLEFVQGGWAAFERYGKTVGQVPEATADEAHRAWQAWRAILLLERDFGAALWYDAHAGNWGADDAGHIKLFDFGKAGFRQYVEPPGECKWDAGWPPKGLLSNPIEKNVEKPYPLLSERLIMTNPEAKADKFSDVFGVPYEAHLVPVWPRKRKLEGHRISGAKDIVAYMSGAVQSPQERIYVLLMNQRNEIMGVVMVTQGTINASVVAPREIFAAAVAARAVSIVVVHNHPSGDATPSEADLHMTTVLMKAGETLDIPVLDHIILGADGKYTSLQAAGLMPRPQNRVGETQFARANPLDPACMKIGKAYLEAPDVSKTERAKRLYAQYSAETEVLFNMIRLKVDFTTADPYKTAAEMLEQVTKTGVMRIYSGGNDHPLLSETANLKGRAVHDLLAHLVCGCPFTATGEFNAFEAQAALYSVDVRPLLFTEIVGQTCAYIAQGEKHAEQKVLFLPERLEEAAQSMRKRFKGLGLAGVIERGWIAPEVLAIAERTGYALRYLYAVLENKPVVASNPGDTNTGWTKGAVRTAAPLWSRWL